MKIVRLIFLILSILLPLIFIALTIINFKTVRKNKKSKVRIFVAIVLLFGINFAIYKFTGPNDFSKVVKSNTNMEEKEDIKPVSDNISEPLKVLNGTTSKGMKIETKDGVTKIDGLIFVNKDYSLPNDYIPQNTQKAITKDTKTCAGCIVKEAYEAFEVMQSEATKKGLKLWIQSGYRSYTYQEALYKTYVKKDGEEKANTYSAKAGHSEHQTGYAIDLNSVKEDFADTKEGKWIAENAYKYGFILRYPKGKEIETGYKYEPWHLRYVGTELSTLLYNNGDWISLEDYFGLV